MPGHHTESQEKQPNECCVWQGSPGRGVAVKGRAGVGIEVWVGLCCTILAGFSAEHGVGVAAKTTVTRDVPAYARVGGRGAMLFRLLLEQCTTFLLIDRTGWRLTEEFIRENEYLLAGPLAVEQFHQYGLIRAPS